MRKKIVLISTDKALDRGYDEHVHYCKARNLSKVTIQNYDNCVMIVYKFLDYKTPVSTITEKTIQDFVIFCKKEMKQNDDTLSTNLKGFKTILYYFIEYALIKKAL